VVLAVMFHFPQALANGRDKTLLCTNETAGKEIVSVKTDASQKLRVKFAGLQFIPSHLQLFFIEAHREIRVLFQR
jgi:hypothetical protein